MKDTQYVFEFLSSSINPINPTNPTNPANPTNLINPIIPIRPPGWNHPHQFQIKLDYKIGHEI